MSKEKNSQIRCPRCGSEHVHVHGYYVTSGKGRRKRYKCMDCGRIFLEPVEATPSKKRGVEGLKCPACGSTHIVRAGYAISSGIGRKQRYQCMNCGRYFITPTTTTFQEEMGESESGKGSTMP